MCGCCSSCNVAWDVVIAQDFGESHIADRRFSGIAEGKIQRVCDSSPLLQEPLLPACSMEPGVARQLSCAGLGWSRSGWQNRTPAKWRHALRQIVRQSGSKTKGLPAGALARAAEQLLCDLRQQPPRDGRECFTRSRMPGCLGRRAVAAFTALVAA